MSFEAVKDPKQDEVQETVPTQFETNVASDTTPIPTEHVQDAIHDEETNEQQLEIIDETAQQEQDNLYLNQQDQTQLDKQYQLNQTLLQEESKQQDSSLASQQDSQHHSDEDQIDYILPIELFENLSEFLDSNPPSQAQVDHLMNGFIFAKFILDRVNVDQDILRSLRPENTLESRRANWAIIKYHLERINIGIETESIVQGNFSSSLEVFYKIPQQQLEEPEEQDVQTEIVSVKDERSVPPKDNKEAKIQPVQLPRRQLTQSCNLNLLDITAPIAQATNSLELLLILISNSFSVTPQQAVLMMTNDCLYLIQACTKGLKHQGLAPAQYFYKQLLANADILAQLMIDEFDEFKKHSTVSDSLNAITVGLETRLERNAIQVLIQLLKYFDMNHNQLSPLIFKWFQTNIHRMIAMPYELIQSLNSLKLLQERGQQLLRYDLLKHVPTDQYLGLLTDMLPYLTQWPSQLIQCFVDFAGVEAQGASQVAAFTYLTEVWLQYTSLIDESQHTPTLIQGLLRKGAREKAKTVRIAAFMCMFRLLDTFSVHRNISAPPLYRSIIFTILEQPNEPIVREFVWQNLQNLFKQQPSVPVDLLIEPLVKIRFKLYEFDYNLLNFLAWHPNLSQKSAALLLGYNESLILAQQVYAKFAVELYCVILKRFATELADQVLLFTQKCVLKLNQFELDAQPTRKGRPVRKITAIQKQERGLIYFLISKLQGIVECDELQSGLQQQLLQGQYTLSEKTLTSQTLEKLIISQNYTALVLDQKQEVEMGQTALVPYNQTQKAKSFQLKMKATSFLKQVRGQFTQRETERKQMQQETQEKEKRRRVQLKREIEKRRIELGVPAIIDANKTVRPSQVSEHEYQQSFKLQFYDLERDFEQQDKRSLEMHLKSKLLRALFDKYRNTLARNKTLQDRDLIFDGLKRQNQTITAAELLKMFKEHKALSLIEQGELLQVVKIVAFKMGVQTEFTFKQFLVFMAQAALNTHRQQQSVRPGDMLKRMLSFFQQPTSVKQDDEEEEEEEDELIATLIERVEEDEEYQLPAGYQKAYDYSETVAYRLPEELIPFIGKGAMLALPIIDELINKLFPETHILEPFTDFDRSLKIIQVLNKPKAQVKETAVMHLIEKQEKPVAKPRACKLLPNARVQLPSNLKLLVIDVEAEDRKLFNECAETIELMIQALERDKLDIYDTSPVKFTNRLHFELKQKQEEQAEQIKERERLRMEHAEQIRAEVRAWREQKQQEEKEEALRLEKEEQQLQALRSQELLRREQQREAQADTKVKIKQQAASASTKESLSTRKRTSASVVQDQLQLPPLRAKQRSMSVQQALLPVQTPIPVKEEVILPKVTKHKFTPKHVLSQLDQIKKQLLLSEIQSEHREHHFRKAIKLRTQQNLQNKEDRNFEMQFESQLLDFMATAEVAEVFKKFDRQIEKVFRFYCQQGKLEMGFDLEFKSQNMNYREFIKFGIDTRVSPCLVSSETLMGVFRICARMQQLSEATINEGTEFPDKNIIQFISLVTFRKALVRICVISFQKLGGLTVETMQRQKLFLEETKSAEIKLKEFVHRKDYTRQQAYQEVLQQMKSEFEELQKKQDAIYGIKPQKSLVQQTRLEQDFQKYLKQQEGIGNGINKRLEFKQNQKPITVKIAVTAGAFLLKQHNLQVEQQVKQQLAARTDLRDHQHRRQPDLTLITAATVESLFIYVGFDQKDPISQLFKNKSNQQTQSTQLERLESLRRREEIMVAELIKKQLAQIENQKEFERQQSIQKRLDQQKLELEQQRIKLEQKRLDMQNIVEQIVDSAIFVKNDLLDDEQMKCQSSNNNQSFYKDEPQTFLLLDFSEEFEPDISEAEFDAAPNPVTPKINYSEAPEPTIAFVEYIEEPEPCVAVVDYNEQPEPIVTFTEEREGIVLKLPPDEEIVSQIEKSLRSRSQTDRLLLKSRSSCKTQKSRAIKQVDAAKSNNQGGYTDFSDESLADMVELPIDLLKIAQRQESPLAKTQNYKSVLERPLSFMSLPGFKANF